MWGAGTLGEDVTSRRDALLRSMVHTEAVIGFAVYAAMLLAFNLLNLAFPDPGSPSLLVPDSIQFVVFAGMAVVIHRDLVPRHWLAPLIQVSVTVGVLGQLYDYTLNLEPWAPVMLLVMSGTVVLEWRVFWIGNLPLGLVVASTYFQFEPEHKSSWVAATAVAVIAAAGTVRSRRSVATALARAQTKAERLAVEDPLTGLLNRRGLAHEVRFVRGVARRGDDPYFAVFIDVGGLKALNDAHGHEVGDRLLVAVAGAVRRVARETDLACRWGGDEFLIVGAGTCPTPDTMTRRLLAALDSSGLPDEWEPMLWVGAAESTSVDEELHDVIVRADEDLYRLRAQHPHRTR